MAVSIPITFIVIVLFCQSIADKSDVETGKCSFDKYNVDHDLSALKKIRGLFGETFKSQDSKGQFDYTVGICADLKLDDAVKIKNPGAIQRQIPQEGKKTDDAIHNIGSLTDSHIMAGRDWAILEYKSGDAYTSHCGLEGRRTVIVMTCDETIDTADAKMVHIEEETQKQSDCYYLFEMKHKALCPKSSGSVLSVGSILLITFFSVIALYLFFGFLYQRFVLGSKGLEQIPNYEFWKDLGNLEADGCDFVCRSKGRQTNGFRGIGDDQLDVTEEIRDDNLLPM